MHMTVLIPRDAVPELDGPPSPNLNDILTTTDFTLQLEDPPAQQAAGIAGLMYDSQTIRHQRGFASSRRPLRLSRKFLDSLHP